MSIANNPVNPDLVSLVSIINLKESVGKSETGPSKKPGTFNFSFSMTLGIEKEKELIKLVPECIIREVDQNNTPISELAAFTSEFIFKIRQMKQLVLFNKQQGTASIDPGLSLTLTSIAYNTMRGIIHTKTLGTILNGIILPVTDPAELVNKTIGIGTFQVQ
jgi:hypothetical protein